MFSNITMLAHRGLWRSAAEKNQYSAIERALTLGVGIEIDVRDHDGELMVTHDVKESGGYPFADLLPLIKKHPAAMIAINIKSCGLQKLLSNVLNEKKISSYFTFDMAVPDLLQNLHSGLISYTRISEIEQEPVLYNKVQGVWIDMFEKDWVTAENISSHLQNGKNVALVSPELHKRPHENFWSHLKDNSRLFSSSKKNVYLCTDYPEEALSYFNA